MVAKKNKYCEFERLKIPKWVTKSGISKDRQYNGQSEMNTKINNGYENFGRLRVKGLLLNCAICVVCVLFLITLSSRINVDTNEMIQ